MDNAKNQLIERIQSATNILVTVSRNPSVDQLSATLGLTLLLNKLNKHATAVFSGQIPSTIEFLEPEQTLEKTTDSLRDFIIALDKSKADKLRYKVEDEHVRIFITPYRTSITEQDLEFSQGDFNIDMVIALGVPSQDDLDEAIVSHGRILHDATVTSINVTADGGLGTINWHETTASSLSELIASLSRSLGTNLLDEQISTALLTGIVAETHRFSNEKTSPLTMSVSAELMAAGANQQLVATKLEEIPVVPAPPADDGDDHDADEMPPENPDPIEPPKPDDGTLEIEHDGEDHEDNEATETEEAIHDEHAEPDETVVPEPDDARSSGNSFEELAKSLKDSEQLIEPATDEPPETEPTETPEPSGEPVVEAESESEPESTPEVPAEPEQSSSLISNNPPKIMTEPPQLGGRLTANSQPEAYDPSTDPLSLPSVDTQHTLLDRSSATTVPQPTPEPQEQSEPSPKPVSDAPASKPTQIMTGFTPPPPAWVPPSADTIELAQQLHDAASPTPEPTLSSVDPVPSSEPPEAELVPTPAQPEEVIEPPAPIPSSEPTPSVDDARDEVMKALGDSTPPPEPIQALNAQPLGDALHPQINIPEPGQLLQSVEPDQPTMQHAPLQLTPSQPAPSNDPTSPAGAAIVDHSTLPTLPTQPATAVAVAPAATVSDPTAPPEVPPPIIPYNFGAPPPSQ